MIIQINSITTPNSSDAIPATLKTVGSKRNRADSTPDIRSDRYPERIRKPRILFASKLFRAAGQALPLTRAAVTTSNSVATWHNLLTSGLLNTDLEDPTDFEDTPVPTLVSGVIVEDGITAQWVDLATLISYVEKDYNASQPKPIRPGPTVSLLTPLKVWYGSQTSSSGTPPPVLASILLQALIGTDDAIEFFSESLIFEK